VAVAVVVATAPVVVVVAVQAVAAVTAAEQYTNWPFQKGHKKAS
jgi:hypothetical protein